MIDKNPSSTFESDQSTPLSHNEPGWYTIHAFDPQISSTLKHIFLARGWTINQPIHLVSKGAQSVVVCRQHQIMIHRQELAKLRVLPYTQPKPKESTHE